MIQGISFYSGAGVVSVRTIDRPRCSRCSGLLNRVGKTPKGSQKYRCSSCGTYDSEAKRKIAESKQARELEREQKAAISAGIVQGLRAEGFLTRCEMAQQLGVSLTWIAHLSKLGHLEERRQRGRFGRYWVRKAMDESLTIQEQEAKQS